MVDGWRGPDLNGSVNSEALATLLCLQSERDWLDYKSEVDLSSTRDLVELAKDIGAIMMAGGYLVIGADSNGRPSGQLVRPDLFDAASLHAKLAKYLPAPFEVRSAVHEHEGHSYAIIHIPPHRDGLCIFAADGTYAIGKGSKTIFRAGDVFARHGTRSERWQQADIPSVLRHLRTQVEEQHNRDTRAVQLIEGVADQVRADRPWLVLAAVPVSAGLDPSTMEPEHAREFLDAWQLARNPIVGLASGGAAYRQPGRIVLTNEHAVNQEAGWWQIELGDKGEGVAAHALTHRGVAASTGAACWYGMPPDVCDDDTVPIRRDLIEIHLYTLIDLLTAHAQRVGAAGDLTLVVGLLAPPNGEWASLRLLDEATDQDHQRIGWRPAGARADVASMVGIQRQVAVHLLLTDLHDASARVLAARRLAADLLAVFGVTEPSVLTAQGSLKPDGASTDYEQLVWQHANFADLPCDPVSPLDRRRRFEETIAAARAAYRQR